MTRRLCNGLALSALLFVLANEGKGQPEKGPDEGGRVFLWKVASPTNTVYLMGSMHMGKKEHYPLPAPIEEAFAQSKTLVVEADVTKLDQAVVLKLIKTHGAYPKGQSLSKSLSKKTMESLEKHLAAKGINIGFLDSLRPWVVQIVVMAQEIQNVGFSDQLGHERHFLAKAKKAKMPVVELETADSQIRLFSEMSPELQEASLAKTIAESGKMKEGLELIWKTWSTGDAKAMANLLLAAREQPEYKDLMKRVFDDRNVKMADKIEGFLKEGDTYFVIVGAGHLVGDKGIVKILQDKKYQVEQVRRAKVKKKAA